MEKKSPVCAVAPLLQILGQPHVPTIINVMGGDVWGFNQLQQVTGINSRTLTLRLQLLQAEGIIEKVDCPDDARCRYYQLTVKGKKIHKIVQQLEAV